MNMAIASRMNMTQGVCINLQTLQGPSLCRSKHTSQTDGLNSAQVKGLLARMARRMKTVPTGVKMGNSLHNFLACIIITGNY